MTKKIRAFPLIVAWGIYTSRNTKLFECKFDPSRVCLKVWLSLITSSKSLVQNPLGYFILRSSTRTERGHTLMRFRVTLWLRGRRNLIHFSLALDQIQSWPRMSFKQWSWTCGIKADFEVGCFKWSAEVEGYEKFSSSCRMDKWSKMFRKLMA